MTEPTTIPLNRLTLWDGNVRKTGVQDGIAELAASIAAHGLLQALVVRKSARGKFQIIAGQRRYLALMRLVKDGTILKDHPIPCMIAESEIDATELSLAENVVRAPMHPADQFVAFADLIDRGASIADVAARFGVAESVVTKRLKLGRLSPFILEAYRNGDIDLEDAQAFAISDDHQEQERVYDALCGNWNMRPEVIRRMLTEQEVASTDKRVRLIGLDAYRDAGGAIRQDLFCQDGTGYVADMALLERLVAEKLQAIAADVASEGWRWVEIVPEIDYQTLGSFTRRYPDSVPLSDDAQAELDALTQEYDSLSECDDDNEDRLAEIEARIDELEATSRSWSPETLALAGAIVSIGYDGSPRIERGLVRKSDLRAVANPSANATDAPVESGSMKLSDKLVEELTSEKTAAIARVLAGRPDIALAAVVHALLLDRFYPGSSSHSCLDLRATAPRLTGRIAESNLSDTLMAQLIEEGRIGTPLPGNPDDLWSWCLERGQAELLDLLAVVAALSVDAVQRKADQAGLLRLIHADALARAVSLDMRDWYTPTAEDYFARVSRPRIIADIDEAKGEHAPSLEKLKKADLAKRAETLIAGTGWLPQPLRIADATEQANDDADLAQAAE
ncbi:MAG: ParB/RepB/Spo0J family partition protein [Hyphomicrobiaceae bacterium]